MRAGDASLSARGMPPIFHFTDIDNLAGILRAGALQCHRDAPTRIDVGNPGIKANRQQRRVSCGRGGMVCDYVPFYFAPRSPMMYTIMRGNVDGVSTDLSRLVYFVSTTEAVYDAGLPCVYTDGNAAVLITTFFDEPDAIAARVDLPLMRRTMWNSTPDDPDRMRRRMAEFLVHERLPLELVGGIFVKSPRIRASVASWAQASGTNLSVGVRPEWYF